VVAIADRYPKMTPAAQKRLQKRMTDWAKLTPAQHARKRENTCSSKTAAKKAAGG
jgi:hypothetical protein